MINLTLVGHLRLVKGMRLSSLEIEKMVRKVFDALKANNVAQFTVAEDKVFKRAVELVKEELDKEAVLEKEVNQMMDELERQNPNSFERYKMFPLLKKKLAKQKGIIL